MRRRRIRFQARMFPLSGLPFAILYGVITGIGTWVRGFAPILFLILRFVLLGIRYPAGTRIVTHKTRARRLSEKEARGCRE